jgi:hypothetical protein
VGKALLGVVIGRPRFKIGMKDRFDIIHFNNPTGVALAVLCAFVGSSPKFVDGCVGAGAVPALVKLLQNATCPVILGYTFILTDRLLISHISPDGTPVRNSEIAARFLTSGEWNHGSVCRSL